MGDIQRQAEMAGLFDGSLSTCQAELQELMRQIDIMVNNKRLEWEASIKSTEAKLKKREEEITTTRMALDVKTAEANRLSHELTGMERSQKELVSQYEEQVEQLRQELNDLRKRYEKLERHHGKQNDGVERVKGEMEEKLRKARVDLRMAENKIEDHEAQAREWDQQKRAYKHQVEGLEVQRKKIVERCHDLQQECASHKQKSGKMQQLLDQSDLDFRTRFVHIEGQLQRAQDTLDGKNSAIERLEALLEDAAQRKRAAEEENRSLLEDLGRKEHRIHTMDNEVSSLQQELETKEGALLVAQKELKSEVARFENVLASRETSLRSNEDESRLRSMQASEETSRLRTQLQDSQRRIQDLVESEARLKMEVSRLENRLDAVQGDNAALNVELTGKIEELRQLDFQARQHRSASEKQQSQDGIEQRLEMELSGMRREIETLTEALAQRNAMVNSLGAQLSNSEQCVNEERNQRDKLMSEIKIANAELDALRVENRSLLLQPAPIQSTGNMDTRTASDKAIHVQEVNINSLQSQLHAIQQQLKLAQGGPGTSPRTVPGRGTNQTSGPRTVQSLGCTRTSLEHAPNGNVPSAAELTQRGPYYGPGTSPTPDPRTVERLGPRSIQSPGRSRTSFEERTRNGGMHGSPGRPRPGPAGRPGSVSHESSPVKPRLAEESGVLISTHAASPARNAPVGVDQWKQSPAYDSEGLHSIETGSIESGSYDSPLPSPPAFQSLLGDRDDEGEGSSLDITGLSELGLGSDQFMLNRPPSRESVGTRFLREDRQHQAELERILNVHIQDLEMKTTNTLAKHSQRLQWDT